MSTIIDRLRRSAEPSIRYKVLVNTLSEDEGSKKARALRREIKRSSRVASLLEDWDEKGGLRPVKNPYSKWRGAHWVIATLADIGYPSADKDLIPIVDQVLDCWLRPDDIRERDYGAGPAPRSFRGVPIVQGRARRCASQQGNALYAAVTLGFHDERSHQLAKLLMRWQWPDGGWNCDKKPEAATSSFWESLIPLRALSKYASLTGDSDVTDAVARAAELFLQRRLFKRRSDDSVMNPQFLRLHYPCYWRYDILFALKVMAESGYISDPRCAEALDTLESKRLPDGGWPAEERFYKGPSSRGSGQEHVSWGGVNKKRMNEWVTADALFVRRAAGRL
ncbi:hypothetical protein ACFL59_03510 [Planctomycetota bacterium]